MKKRDASSKSVISNKARTANSSNRQRHLNFSGLSLFVLMVFTILMIQSCSPSMEDSSQNKEKIEDSTYDTDPQTSSNMHSTTAMKANGKAVVYQVFTRLFGNQNSTNKPWGTIDENGVGKFNDFSDKALAAIKELGVTHIWYTGVPHHAVITDYTKYGISNDDPDVVKGRAGSPYAVKDYYNVNPDLAVEPENRLAEFEALVARTQRHGMKVIIDIVPNHIARNYQSLTNPKGVVDFGSNDDSSVEYHKHNNFYYVVGEDFKVPAPLEGYRPLGGEPHPLVDATFNESPAKWTGNGARKAQPHFHDWYETIKVNYGVRPDGTYDFPKLPPEYSEKDYHAHLAFWADKEVPDSWKKFRNIVLYWTEKGVDGFRYDMAEMVPVEFWSYLNSSIKQKNSDAFLLAEVYNPSIYRDYIKLGKMDYLYDKVDFYDSIKLIMQGKRPASTLLTAIEKVEDIDEHMLHFLENHDEQRIASPDFAGDARKGMPAMVVSTLIGKSPTMLYFAQALGEPGDGNPGFGRATRTTIFDYWGVPSLQRWINGGKFDGGGLSEAELKLREFYARLMTFSANSQALLGDYQDLHRHNLENPKTSSTYSEKLFSFVRYSKKEKLIVVTNFSDSETYSINLSLPGELIKRWQLNEGAHQFKDILNEQSKPSTLSIEVNNAAMSLNLAPLESKVLLLSH